GGAARPRAGADRRRHPEHPERDQRPPALAAGRFGPDPRPPLAGGGVLRAERGRGAARARAGGAAALEGGGARALPGAPGSALQRGAPRRRAQRTGGAPERGRGRGARGVRRRARAPGRCGRRRVRAERPHGAGRHAGADRGAGRDGSAGRRARSGRPARGAAARARTERSVSGAPIRVLVADDHLVVREGLRRVLEGEPGFEIVAEAATGPDAVALAERHRPDVVVLDISMPGESGIQVAARLRRSVPETRVLVLSVHDDAQYVLESVRAGAHGYLLKDAAATELRRAVRAVQEGEAFFSPPIARRLSAAVRGELERERRSGQLDSLSAREREVLEGIARGR